MGMFFEEYKEVTKPKELPDWGKEIKVDDKRDDWDSPLAKRMKGDVRPLADEPEKKGLTPEDKLRIKEESGWPDEVIDQIGSVHEYETYRDAGLQPYRVEDIMPDKGNGWILMRPDADFPEQTAVSDDNYSRIFFDDKPPLNAEGRPVDVYRVGDQKGGILAELTPKEYEAIASERNVDGKIGIDNAFNGDERRFYWLGARPDHLDQIEDQSSLHLVPERRFDIDRPHAPVERVDEPEKKGLTPEEKKEIQEETGWPDEIIDKIGSMEEYEIYKNAGLQAQEIDGRWCLVRGDIDWDQVDEMGRTNQERADQGLSPINKDGKVIELHHIGQHADSPLAELTPEEHRGQGNDTILHDKSKETEIDRTVFARERSDHWDSRAHEGGQ